jgi:hypothetical protein|uniref:Uncharacterized protein n=1 Tax=Picea glauca TaxID=3330 RepID=A0A101M5F2_PICGL|nr:hypothetical protein ABT39_MTgene1264 [Picea glauca]QHR88273.1 hypothetical protein Q903MT_gene2286 [Picea sitchensis]
MILVKRKAWEIVSRKNGLIPVIIYICHYAFLSWPTKTMGHRRVRRWIITGNSFIGQESQSSAASHRVKSSIGGKSSVEGDLTWSTIIYDIMLDHIQLAFGHIMCSVGHTMCDVSIGYLTQSSHDILIIYDIMALHFFNLLYYDQSAFSRFICISHPHQH